MVSTIIPAFNVEKWLPRALASATESSENSEVIIVDDASTDATHDVAQAIARDDSRVRVIRLPANRGAGAARNAGIAVAKGDWIAFLDADDWWLPQRLSSLVRVGERYGSQIVSDDVLVVRESNPKSPTSTYAYHGVSLSEPTPLSLTEFFDLDWIVQPIFRSAFLRRHNIVFGEDIRHGEDFLFYVAALIAGGSWVLVPDAYYCYFVRKGSVTTSMNHYRDNLLATERAVGMLSGFADRKAAFALYRRLLRVRQSSAEARLRLALHSGGAVEVAKSALGLGPYLPQLSVRILRRLFRGPLP
jgi:succinoglycan biosynthesis protein ExoO